ncbi:MAG: signal peptidase I [Candidatus Krumholzibacteriia bacterium]
MPRRDKAVQAARAASRSKVEVARRAPKARWKIREYADAIVVAVLLALFFRQFVIQAFRIPSSSMESTLLVGDFLFVNKFLYGAQIPFTSWRLPAVRPPRRGDIIVFKAPTDGRDFIKRCVAVAGDTVEVRGKVLYLNGEPRDEPYKQHTHPGLLLPGQGPRDFMKPVVVPEGYIFMLGDNRDNSHDSRFWGPLRVDRVRGKAMFIYFSIDTSRGWLPPHLRVTRFGDIIR